jgi:hypothetical protein
VRTRASKPSGRSWYEAAHPEVPVVHAHARDHLEQVEDLFALAHGVEEERQRPHVEDAGAQEQQVARDPVELDQDDAGALRPFGNLGREQLLGGEHVGELVPEAMGVVHAVRVRDGLLVRAVLHRLLEAAVQVPDLRREPRDPLAVEVHDEAQHAVRARVLGPDVDAHEFGLELAAPLAPELFDGVPGALEGHASPPTSSTGTSAFDDTPRRAPPTQPVRPLEAPIIPRGTPRDRGSDRR